MSPHLVFTGADYFGGPLLYFSSNETVFVSIMAVILTTGFILTKQIRKSEPPRMNRV